MTDQLNSQLSAFIDDALSTEESDLLVRRLCRDDELRETVARYTLIGDVVRGGTRLRAPQDFPERIMRRLDGQPLPLPQSADATADSPRPMMIAVAASVVVAAIALFTLPGRMSTPQAPVQLADAPVETTPVLGLASLDDSDSSAANYAVPTVIPAARQPAESRARLNKYLVQHLGATGSRQGLVTYRNVGYVTEPDSQ